VCRKSRKIAQSVARDLKAKFIILDEQYRIYRVIVPSPQPSPEKGEGEILPSPFSGEGSLTLDFAEMQGKTIEEDLGRRDLTLNAMAMPFTSSRRIVSRDPAASASKPLGPVPF